MKNNQIAVVGSRFADGDISRLAESVGVEVAKSGATLVCGGLSGVMEAACRGARKAGGLTVGIIPTNNSLDANEFVDVVIAT